MGEEEDEILTSLGSFFFFPLLRPRSSCTVALNYYVHAPKLFRTHTGYPFMTCSLGFDNLPPHSRAAP